MPASDASESAAAYQLGMLALQAGHDDDSVPWFARAVALAPEQDRGAVAASALMARARLLAVQGRLEDAAPLLQEAARHQPDVGQVHANLGLVLGAIGRVREAAASYRQALAIDGAAETHHA